MLIIWLKSLIIRKVNRVVATTYLWLYVKVQYQIWSQQPNLRCLQKTSSQNMIKYIKVHL